MDPNTALVFETIGLIKKSLQCSICLDILNDPHSTRCNHQFCSRCIRKVVDERKEKKQDALCPLCKNPITKRSLTSNPRLKEIVDVVRKLNNAFQEDAGIPDSPYPLVNSRLNGQSYLQFSRLNPTPLKLVKFKSLKSGGVRAEQNLDSSVNHQPSNNSLHSNEQPVYEKPISPREVVSQQRRITGFEILSLLESEEDAKPEPPTKCIDEEVKGNDEPLQENCGNTDHPTTRRSSQPTQSQTGKSQENVNTANTKSSGSLTIDPGKSSQSSVLSDNSVSMLDGLLSQQSRDEAGVQSKGIEEMGAKVPGAEEEEPYHSTTVNIQKISKPSQEGDNDISPAYKCYSERSTSNLIGNSNDMFNDPQKSPNDKHGFRRTPEVDRSKSKPSPSSVDVNKSSIVGTTTPKNGRSKSVQSPASINSNESNSIERTSDQYSSERVPASVDSDSQSYQVIPLPRYEKYHSDDEISPEFPSPRSLGVLSGREKDDFSDEINNPTADNISSQDELCLSSEKEPRCDPFQTQQSTVGPAGNISPKPENCRNSEASVLLLSQSGSSFRHQKSKRKRSEGDTNEVSPIELPSPCSRRVLSEVKKINSCDEIINPTAEDISSQDELCLPSEKGSECDTLRTEQSKVAPSVEIIPNAENSKNSEASVISPSQSGSSFRHQKSKRKRSVGDNDSLKKYPRLSNDTGLSMISIETDRETYEHGLDKCGLSNLEIDHNQVNCTAKEVSKGTSNNLHTKMGDPKVNDQENCCMSPSQKANRSDNSEDDIIPPTPPVRMDVGCTSHKKGSTIELLNQSKISRSQNITGVRKHVYENEVVDEDCFRDDVGDDDEKLWPSRSQKLAKVKKHKYEDELVDEDDCFKNDASDGNGEASRSQITRGREPVCENEGIDPPDDFFKDDDCDEEGELMVVSDGGRSPIMDDDQMYSSQENLNVALLRRLAPGSASHKESETESDGETSDYKNADTTSISSLTDADGVEVSSQRIKYLHEVLAQTGGEIEKLTADLKNLRKSEVNAQPNKLRHNHADFDKSSDMKINKDNDNDNFENDSSSDKEEEKYHDSDKENNIGDSDVDSSSEKENENSESSDVENNINIRKGAIHSDADDQENENDSDASSENEDGKTSGVVYDVRKNDNDNNSSSDKDQKESDDESEKEDDIKENDHVVEIHDNDDSDSRNDNDDDEILEHCALSPPPALDPSTLKLTKLPPAIRNLKKMLRHDVDSEEEQDNTNDDHSSPDKSYLRKTISELQKVFGNNHSNDDPDLKNVGLNNRSHDTSKAHHHGLHRTDKPTDNNKKNESRYERSQKENSAELKRRSTSRDSSTRKSQDNSKQDKNVKKPPDEVLTELRVNTGPKQRTLTSMLGSDLNRELAKKAPQTVKSSLCFVITRLPKQFVSLAGYLAKRNGGRMSGDVSEETTHIIMPTDSKMQASRKNYTIKYLLGIALGKWIVSQHWITACVKSGRLVDEKQYEVKGDVEAAQSHVPNLARTTRENMGPLLFDGVSVVSFGEFNAAISRDQVCQLVRYCGGKIIEFSHELLKASSTMSDLIVICDLTLSQKTGLQIKDLCRRYSTFPVSAEWVTDSVANYQLQDIEEYRMDI